MTPTPTLPIGIIGAGPVGLAAAAHLLERGLTPVLFEAGPDVGTAVTAWGHLRMFSPWQHTIDPAARRLLEASGWVAPRDTTLPYGAELVEQYLRPLAALPALRGALHPRSTVTAVSRLDPEPGDPAPRGERPFVLRVRHADGREADHRVRAVLDCSGTWGQPTPLGRAGLPAPGEAAATRAGLITGPVPDVTGTERARFAGRHTLVIGSGHSAMNTLLSLGRLVKNDAGTRVSWAVRGTAPGRLYGGGDRDELPARGALGQRLRHLVEDGHIELLRAFHTTGFTLVPAPAGAGRGLAVTGATPAGERTVHVNQVVPAAGFRPEVGMLRELHLDLDPAVEAPRRLGTLIDPAFHSCGTVPAHGAAELSHPEADFYLAGMKSYGRAPTFLLATGYEQVRSIAAALAGDEAAAAAVQLVLPATGVCSA